MSATEVVAARAAACLPVYGVTGSVMRTDFRLYANLNCGNKMRTREGFAERIEHGCLRLAEEPGLGGAFRVRA